jgi:uncharacterized damage-inducible protein DinB
MSAKFDTLPRMRHTSKEYKMTATVPVSAVKDAMKLALGEAFDTAIGMFLDKGDSLWPTLEHVTAEQASVPINPGGNSIASQVNHMVFYFDVMAAYMRNDPPEKPDWSAAWKVVEVDDEQWRELTDALRQRQHELLGLIDAAPDEAFTDPDILGGTYAIVAHTAFHLGQIRHALAAQGR